MDVNPEPDALETLTEFLYIAPVGLIKFQLDGTVDLINPMAAQLLVPMAPDGNLSDAYLALAPLSPALAHLVRDFPDPSGRVLDHERCAMTIGTRPTVLSLTVHRVHGGSYMAVLEDVTILAEQERQLHQDRRRFRAIFDNVRDYAIYTIDPEGRVDEWNQSLQRFGGWRSADVVGRPLDVFFPLDERRPGFADSLLAGARQTGSVETEGWYLRQDGSRLWANTVLTALPDADGAVRGFVVVSRDMTERKRIEDELRRLATTDPLTGAFNRRHGQSYMAEAFRDAGGEGQRPAVLMLDIDHFKSINDRHGHDVGDAALCAVVDACRAILGETLPVVRWGGEEFLVVLPSTDADLAAHMAQRLRAAICGVRVRISTGELAMTVSIGVALDRGGGPENLVHRADEALYAAKRNGRDRVIMSN